MPGDQTAEIEWDAVARTWKPVSRETTCAVIDGVAYTVAAGWFVGEVFIK